MSYYFLGRVVVLAALLFFPASKLIWVLSVRRLQRRTGRELSPEEVKGQLKRARILAVPVVIVFSYLFNLQLLGGAGNG
jgi:hypothetical protein